MKNNKFLTATFILMIGGLITKILGFIIRIIYTRMVGNEAIALYSLVMPTYSLLLTIATLSLPIVISKLISEHKYKSLKILSSATIITLVLNLIVIIIIYFTKDFIAVTLLNDERCSILLISMALTFPFVSISSILKGYFYGKQKMVPHTISNIIEQIVRLLLLYLIIPPLVTKGITASVVGLILLSIASELASILTFLFFLPKKFTITKKDFKPDLKTTKDILNISLPTVSSRLIGNIGFFFEPIILTNVLLLSGYSMNFILTEYGAYNAYSISLLAMPSFFIQAISSSLLPEISRFYYQKNILMVKRRFKQALILSLIVGLIFSGLIYISRDYLLETLYNTLNGSNYIRILAPFFVLFYLEGPLQSVLQAIGQAKTCMFITFIAIIAKLVSMALLSLCHIGMYSLVIAEIIDIIIVVLMSYIAIKKSLYN
ncbi:MAG: oligosaccharide flippase family protein [Bacilli bacterium]|jgi:stage V sporulation protein B|nr:oligosaccharide flippase family protein [Bacilli bacterium]